jgi:hypothetical protein
MIQNPKHERFLRGATTFYRALAAQSRSVADRRLYAKANAQEGAMRAAVSVPRALSGDDPNEAGVEA